MDRDQPQDIGDSNVVRVIHILHKSMFTGFALFLNDGIFGLGGSKLNSQIAAFPPYFVIGGLSMGTVAQNTFVDPGKVGIIQRTHQYTRRGRSLWFVGSQRPDLESRVVKFRKVGQVELGRGFQANPDQIVLFLHRVS